MSTTERSTNAATEKYETRIQTANKAKQTINSLKRSTNNGTASTGKRNGRRLQLISNDSRRYHIFIIRIIPRRSCDSIWYNYYQCLVSVLIILINILCFYTGGAARACLLERNRNVRNTSHTHINTKNKIKSYLALE